MRQILTAILLAAVCSQAFAWSEAGHKIVGSIAFRQLTPEQQAKVVAILKNHPRWQEDFASKMPAELTTDAEKNEWIFQQAAVWPDLVKSLRGDASKFNHPAWHYIDLPTFLTPEDKAAMDGTLKENISTDLPASEADTVNAIQAIKLARKLVADKATPDDEKAVMLCWIFHDVGDIHQPLHSTALYSRNLFPTVTAAVTRLRQTSGKTCTLCGINF